MESSQHLTLEKTIDRYLVTLVEIPCTDYTMLRVWEPCHHRTDYIAHLKHDTRLWGEVGSYPGYNRQREAYDAIEKAWPVKGKGFRRDGSVKINSQDMKAVLEGRMKPSRERKEHLHKKQETPQVNEVPNTFQLQLF